MRGKGIAVVVPQRCRRWCTSSGAGGGGMGRMGITTAAKKGRVPFQERTEAQAEAGRQIGRARTTIQLASPPDLQQQADEVVQGPRPRVVANWPSSSAGASIGSSRCAGLDWLRGPLVVGGVHAQLWLPQAGGGARRDPVGPREPRRRPAAHAAATAAGLALSVGLSLLGRHPAWMHAVAQADGRRVG